MSVRRSKFAGSWYPGTESDCRQAIEEFSNTSVPCPSTGRDRVGGIVPHAGWVYSGKIACNVIKCLKNDKDPETIVIFGRHLHAGSNNYIMTEGGCATPVGDLEIDHEIAKMLASEFSFTVETASDCEPDNTIELQLPFIKHFFPETKIIPIGVPPNSASPRIGERLAEMSKTSGRRISVLGSTDLTHYGQNYGFVPKGEGEKAVTWVRNENDKRMIELILDMDDSKIISESSTNSNACCAGAVATAIASSKKLGATRGEHLGYLSSYDITPNSSFVGYVGVVFS